MKSANSSVFNLLLIIVLSLLTATIAESQETSSQYPLALSSTLEKGSVKEKITESDLATLPAHTAKLSLEFDEVERVMTFVYLSDFIDAFYPNSDADFWLANCSDGYQSNYSPEIIQATKPFLIYEVDGEPLGKWLDEIGHPEWGPYIIDTQDDTSLRDPGHKKPWGVREIVATRYEQVLNTLPAAFAREDNSLGADIYFNACASCHGTSENLFGGNLSSRNIVAIGTLAKHAEGYFEKMLKSPAETNPLAGKMPAYSHYGPKEIEAIKSVLAAD